MEATSRTSRKAEQQQGEDFNPTNGRPGRSVCVVKQGEWECIDSGATETVVGEEMVTSVETKEGAASRRGVMYEVANGERIPNLGEKRFVGHTEEGMERKVTAQVAEVNKALLSVKKIVAAGNRVVFDTESYIEDKASGERMWPSEAQGMYMLKMWVKNGPF